MNNPSFRHIIKSALLLGIPLIILFIYNFIPVELSFFGVTLKKINNAENQELNTSPEKDILSTAKSISFKKSKVIDSMVILKKQGKRPIQTQDSSKSIDVYNSEIVSYPQKSDSSSQRILLMGDSQAGGIMYALNDYCLENNHKLVGVFTWFSATILNFAYSSKVEQIINQFKPTLIVVCLGLNELYAKDISKRTLAAEKFRSKLGTTPYLWVGPANFTEDFGINRVFEQTAASGRFMSSKNLAIPRGTDKRHPSQLGYKIWMDYVAGFVQGNPIYPFNFNPPKKKGGKFTSRVITANAAKDRGY